MQPDSLLADYVSFKESLREITYDGELIDGVSIVKTVQIAITLVDVSQTSSTFWQTVVILPPIQALEETLAEVSSNSTLEISEVEEGPGPEKTETETAEEEIQS